MWYYKINLWLTSRIFFYNCCFSFLSLAKVREPSDLYSTVAIFLTAGFIVGAIAQRLLHKPEAYAFQNLGVSNLQRYSFAYVFHIAFALIAFFFIWIIANYV